MRDELVSVIADISLDHQNYLGNTLTEIAREKAGIIRAGGIVVTLPQQPQANDVIGNTILALGARGVSAVQYVPPVSPNSRSTVVGRSEPGVSEQPAVVSRYPLQVLGKKILVESPLIGRHQLRNIALAISAAEELGRRGFPVTAESIERGIRETHWPGRFQIVPARDQTPEFVLDVAHNPAGAWALRSAISGVYDEHPFTLIFGAMRDKAIGEMAEILFPLAERVIATRADNPRAATPDDIHQAAARISADIEDAPDVASALASARRAGPQGLVVVTGSIYIVGEALQALGLKA